MCDAYAPCMQSFVLHEMYAPSDPQNCSIWHHQYIGSWSRKLPFQAGPLIAATRAYVHTWVAHCYPMGPGAAGCHTLPAKATCGQPCRLPQQSCSKALRSWLPCWACFAATAAADCPWRSPSDAALRALHCFSVIASACAPSLPLQALPSAGLRGLRGLQARQRPAIS